MRLERVGMNIGITIEVAKFQFIRPDGNAGVIMDEDDDYEDAIMLARKAALRSFVQSVDDCIKLKDLANQHHDKFIDYVVRDMIGDK